MPEMNALGEDIKNMIEQDGPMSVERFMQLALTHPEHGYYINRDPLGASGDFITAPEISQMFGELLGLWAAEVWALMGSPDKVHLVELGPGRGTLMADALRAARVVSDFREKIQVHLVETSPALRDIQRERLSSFKDMLHWHDTIEDLPDGPSIIIANEFFDALPVRQFMKADDGWHERVVGIGDNGDLEFGLAPEREPLIVAQSPQGTMLEVGFAAYDCMRELAGRLVKHGGAMAVIDYGHVKTGPGETLQAMKAHARAEPLDAPGEADLTVHVDFANLARAASAAGANISGPIIQADFLTGLGIFERAAGLKRNASVRQAMDIDRALLRLVSTGQETGINGKPVPGMGALFKVIGISSTDMHVLPGFERDRKE